MYITLYVSDNDINVISNKLNEDLCGVTTWLNFCMNKLFFNMIANINAMLKGSSSRLCRVQDNKFTVLVNYLKLDRVIKAKWLRVVNDDELLWHEEVNGVTQKIPVF